VKDTEVTAGLAESNGSLLPGLWRDPLHVTCGLTACTPGSAPGPTLGNEYGKTLPFFMSCYTHKMAIVSWPQTLWRHFTLCYRRLCLAKYGQTWHVSSTEPEVHNISPEENRAIAAGNVHQKFGKIWTSSYWDMLPDEHTDGNTNTLVAAFPCPTKDEVKSAV